MNHDDFVGAWEKNEIQVDVNRSMALQIANSSPSVLPKRYKAAHVFWSWIWMFSIPVAFAIMYFYAWWAGLISLFFITPVLSHSTKKSAMQFMIDYALENSEFYQFAIKEGIIELNENTTGKSL